MIVFVYLFSTSVWLVDEMILQHTSLKPVGLTGADLTPSTLVSGEGEHAHNFDNLTDASLGVKQDGGILDGIAQFSASSYDAIWLALDLLSGSYMFFVLGEIGLPLPAVQLLQWIFPFLVLSQVIWFVAGRY